MNAMTRQQERRERHRQGRRRPGTGGDEGHDRSRKVIADHEHDLEQRGREGVGLLVSLVVGIRILVRDRGGTADAIDHGG